MSIALPGSLDPRDIRSPDSVLVASQVFDGLVAQDPASLETIPAVAGTWEVLEGGEAVSFRLRTGSLFHDGSPVRAQDFVAAWNRVVDPERPSPFSFLLEPVLGYSDVRAGRAESLSGVTAVDELNLEVRLDKPRPDFVAALAHPALSPVPLTAATEGFGSMPVGNGPYRVTGPVGLGTPISLEAFDQYYGGIPPIPAVEFLIDEDPNEAWPDFLGGRVDIATIPTSLITEAQGQFGSAGVVTLARVLYCGFNLEVRRLRSPQLRKAVSLAIDREFIATRVYSGLALPASGLVPPTLPGHDPEVCGENCTRDSTRASSLVSRLPERDRRLNLDYADSPIGLRLATALSAELEEVGFAVNARPHDEDGYRELLESGKQELFCLAWVADYPRAEAILEPLLASSSRDNRTGNVDTKLDALLDRSQEASDPVDRQELYRQAEARALSLLSVVPIAWFRSRVAVKPYVRGFALDPLGVFDVASLSIEA